MLSLILATVLLPQAETDLLAKSRFLVETGHWTEHSEDVPIYSWVDSHHILYCVGENYYPHPAPRWFIRDVSTQASSELTALASEPGGTDAFWDPLPNPQGTRLLWATMDKTRKPKWAVTDLGGKVIGSWPRHAMAMMMSVAGQDQSWTEWSADGQSIIECESQWKPATNLKLHTWRRNLSNLSMEIEYPSIDVVSKPENRSVVYDLGNGKAMWFEEESVDPPRLQVIIQWSIEKAGEEHKTSFAVPKEWGTWRPIVSPDHKSVLWEVWATRLLKIGIWASGIDGSNLHKVGAIKLDPKSANNGVPGFGEIHWIPGRQAASFCYRQKIYQFAIP